MITIELKDVRIYADHGVLEGEERTGNNYLINLVVKFQEPGEGIKSLKETINYVELYEIVKQRLGQRSHLIEQLCEDILANTKSRFPSVTEGLISIHKLQPPIENFEGSVGVSIHKLFND